MQYRSEGIWKHASMASAHGQGGSALTLDVAGVGVGDFHGVRQAGAGQAPGLHGLALQLARLEGDAPPRVICAAALLSAPEPCCAALSVPAPVSLPSRLLH